MPMSARSRGLEAVDPGSVSTVDVSAAVAERDDMRAIQRVAPSGSDRTTRGRV